MLGDCLALAGEGAYVFRSILAVVLGKMMSMGTGEKKYLIMITINRLYSGTGQMQQR
jgi:hypothetical protein